MSEHRNVSSSRRPADRASTREIYSPNQEPRPGNRYLTELTDGDGDYCVMLCTLPPGVVVPLHSHSDRETFYVLSGTPDAYVGDHWETLGAGDVVDVQYGIRHAWRNSSEAFVSMLCVTTMRMGRFLRDTAQQPVPALPARMWIRRRVR